jgi:hypothetical protein
MSLKSHGAGWVVYQDDYPNSATVSLVSILPPRMSRESVAAFVEQVYVDRFATIEGRLSYKKHPRNNPLCETLFDRGGSLVHVGNGPFFHTVYARRITLEGTFLKVEYRILVDASDLPNPVFEQRQMTVPLGGIQP